MYRKAMLWTPILLIVIGAPALPAAAGERGPDHAQPLLQTPANPAIDMVAHLELAQAAARHRESRRLSEAQFAAMAAQPGVVVLDARSALRYAQLHIAGAVNLSFPDFTQESLAQSVGGLDTTVLIYCNNNFVNEPEAFPTKRVEVALNLSTYESLYAYGYRNVYELGPLLDPQTSALRFAGSRATPEMAAR